MPRTQAHYVNNPECLWAHTDGSSKGEPKAVGATSLLYAHTAFCFLASSLFVFTLADTLGCLLDQLNQSLWSGAQALNLQPEFLSAGPVQLLVYFTPTTSSIWSSSSVLLLVNGTSQPAHKAQDWLPPSFFLVPRTCQR